MTKNKNIFIFIIIIVLVGLGLLLLNGWLKKDIETEIAREGATSAEEALRPINTIVVPEQAGGEEAFIEHVSFIDGGFVVIHRASEEVTPGAIIGVSDFLPAGVKENFLIDLSEEVLEGDVLFAMLHNDDGDETFSFPGPDVPLAGDEEAIVLMKFTIVGEGALENEVKL
ncbi:MAG: hypothetical protein BMS9Abin13_446 [Patescibacteria group bacterium]|nr:MAG: hypothetical protein BMS9Abin13_446 [Patescibacteria group bacterium]